MLGWQEVIQLKKPWKVEQTKNSCLGSMLKAEPCHRCVEVCTQQAITVQGRLVNREETVCNDCGLCLRVCPEQVFTSPYMVEGLQARVDQLIRLGHKTLAITCEQDPSVPADLTTFDGLVLGCLGTLQTEQLVTWALGGINHIHLNITACTACPTKGLALLRHSVSHAKGLLRSLGWSGEIIWGRPTELSNGEANGMRQQAVVDRRKFLNSIKSEVEKGLFSLVEKATQNIVRDKSSDEIKPETGATQVVATKGTLPYRGLFIEALQSKNTQALQGAGETSLWRGIHRRKECSKCKICSFFCWSGAIERKESAGMVELYFDGSKCNSCRYCILACPEEALTSADVWKFTGKQLL